MGGFTAIKRQMFVKRLVSDSGNNSREGQIECVSVGFFSVFAYVLECQVAEQGQPIVLCR